MLRKLKLSEQLTQELKTERNSRQPLIAKYRKKQSKLDALTLSQITNTTKLSALKKQKKAATKKSEKKELKQEIKKIEKINITTNNDIQLLQDSMDALIEKMKKIDQACATLSAARREAIKKEENILAAQLKQAAETALPDSTPEEESALNDTQEYRDFIDCLNTCKANHQHTSELLSAANELAATYRNHPDTNYSKEVLVAAKNVLVANNADTQARFRIVIDKNENLDNGERNYSSITAGVAIAFLSAAIIAVGIALLCTGVLAELGGPLILLGAMGLIAGISWAVAGSIRCGDAKKLHHFDDAAVESSKLGLFAAREKPSMIGAAVGHVFAPGI